MPIPAFQESPAVLHNAYRILGLFVLCGLILPTLLSAADQQYSQKKSSWHGFDKYELQVDGRRCSIVAPQDTADGKPWIWRARFFGHEPQADIALLKLGYHVTYCDVGGLFGAPSAVGHWDAFYDHVTSKFGFSKKVALEGMSRGGLIIYNWAAQNPEKVSCIYGDAPVCDIKSWPGGKGKGKGSPPTWKQCLNAYGFTEAEAMAHKKNPIDQLEPLAKAGIPLLHVVGQADVVVPVAENTDIIEQRYKKLGGTITVIRKEGIGHHPHSLKDPKQIVDFVVKHTPKRVTVQKPVSYALPRNVIYRGSLSNSFHLFETLKTGTVAFIGGSITEMNGYRPMVSKFLTERFPETKFSFIDAGISSTCSTTGAFRLNRDVLSQGTPDLFFIEFAVNDDQDAGHTREACIRGVEGIIRQARAANPNMDIVVTFFVNPGMLATLQKGDTPLSMGAHTEVLEHYQISTNHLAKEVADQITAGELTWAQFGGTHPKPHGNAIAAKMIEGLLSHAWDGLSADAKAIKAHGALPKPLDPLSYGEAKFVDPQMAKVKSGWKWATPNWSALPGGKRSRFTSIPMLAAENAGDECSFTFEGTTVGAFVVAGPDAGIVEASVDGGEFEAVNLYHHYSRGLHYPRTVIFATDLKPGKHELTLRISEETKSKGHAARIMQFTVN